MENQNGESTGNATSRSNPFGTTLETQRSDAGTGITKQGTLSTQASPGLSTQGTRHTHTSNSKHRPTRTCQQRVTYRYKKISLGIALDQSMTLADYEDSTIKNASNNMKAPISEGGEYEIKSILHHIGDQVSTGHYTTEAVRSNVYNNQVWVNFNDHQCTPIQFPNISKNASAYILLYVLSNNMAKAQMGRDNITPPNKYNPLAPTVATNTDISIGSCMEKHCLIPTVTFLEYFSKSNYQNKNGSGLHRYQVDYKQAEGRLFCADCADDPVGMKRRLANVVFRSDEYHDFLRKRTSWFERDFIDSYGILMQHDIHCSITWFFPNPELTPIRDKQRLAMPCFVKG
jgi:Ubiquitin carboxyl-terminal hydrolase